MPKILIATGIFMVLFATCMAEPMTSTAFIIQIGLIIGGLITAITGGIFNR